MASIEVTARVRAARAEVYRALVTGSDVAAWRVPDDTRADVHTFDARPGGNFRMTLHFDDPTVEGKSGASTDTFAGTFVDLVPDVRVVEHVVFEADDPAFAGTMVMTTTLTDDQSAADDAGLATIVTVRHDGIPTGIAPADDEMGTRMALRRLAELVETRTGRRRYGRSIAIGMDAGTGAARGEAAASALPATVGDPRV